MNLMEVCVSVAVLSAGALGLCSILDSYNRICDMERQKVRGVVDALSQMERVIETGLSCSEARSLTSSGSGSVVRLDSVPATDLYWVTVKSSSDSGEGISFRRLVECR